MARFSAFLDACVLVPIALADTLLRLAEADLYRPLWSERVLDEMVEAIEVVHPGLADGAARARADAMQHAFDDARVTGWRILESGITLPDPDDRHVVAAALRGRADMIVTANLRDFPLDVLGAVGLEVQHPDDFLLNQLDLDPDLTMATLHRQAAATKRPAITTTVLLEHLTKCGVPRFASEAAHQLWRGL
jgi:predicted nucleic acid-binding protein